jgi:hypothetical protein
MTELVNHIEPEETSASLASFMSNEELVARVRGVFKKIGDELPFILELRARFARLKRGRANICGCMSWQEFCIKHLHRSDRRIRQIIAAYSIADESKRLPSGKRLPNNKRRETDAEGRERAVFEHLRQAMNAIVDYPDDRSLEPIIRKLRDYANELEVVERKKAGEREKKVRALGIETSATRSYPA